MSASGDQLAGALQENTLSLLCVSDEHCQLVRHSVPVELFSTFLYRDVVSRVYDYIDKFKKAPKAHLPDLVEDLLKEKGQRGELVQALLENISDLSEGLNEQYVVTQLEQFTRQQMLKLGVVEATKAIQDGNLEEAERVLERSMKDRLRMFDAGMDLEAAYKAIGEQEDNERILTGIQELDTYGYGPGRKELIVFMAPIKRGKTWWLVHLAKRGILQRWSVLYVTLEVDERIIGQRLLQAFFSMTKRETEDLQVPHFDLDDGILKDIHLKQIKSRPSLSDAKQFSELGDKLKKLRGRKSLMIKQFPTGALTMGTLKAYLSSLESQSKFIPDLIIVDYPDLMKLDSENYRISLGALYKDLRGLAVERNCAVAVASQANREGSKVKTVGEQHAAEDYSKMATADSVISYGQTSAEKELKVARLFTVAGRNDRDKFSVLIAQAYEMGQFCLQSRMLDQAYWVMMEKKRAKMEAADVDPTEE